jgi:4-amino-4-deoxy-L-arabinose transferase-like glycosyltransferase
MDGRLILDGLIPKVDFDSRQVLYSYAISWTLRIFGASYVDARLLPFISTLGIILLIFLISKRLFNERVGLLATTIYAFLPLSVMESAIVKTEPLTTLLSCLGVYLVIMGVESERKAGLFFFLSGFSLALAFYVRESSLAVLTAIFLFFLVIYWKRFLLFFKNFSMVIIGYLSVCFMVVAFYTQFLTVSQIWHSPINPLHIILKTLQKHSAVPLEGEVASHNLDVSTGGFESWNLTVSYLDLTLFTHLFLIFGLLLSVIIFVNLLLVKRGAHEPGKIIVSFSLLYSWIFSLTSFYLYWTLQRGFFMQYFGEFLPPLTIVFAFVVYRLLPKLESQKDLKGSMAILAMFLPAVFFFHAMQSEPDIKSIAYVSMTIIGVAYFYFSPRIKLQKWLYAFIATGIMLIIVLKLASLGPSLIKAALYVILLLFVYLAVFMAKGLNLRRDFSSGLSFIGFSLLFSATVLSMAISGRKMDVAFDSVWSPKTVAEASEYIKVNSKEGDQVLSGGVIWELESNRRPFMNESHPLGYMHGIPKEKVDKIERQFEVKPPQFIVLDGYTEETYLRNTHRLQTIMDEKYELRKIIDGSRYPVKIYGLKDTVAQ